MLGGDIKLGGKDWRRCCVDDLLYKIRPCKTYEEDRRMYCGVCGRRFRLIGEKFVIDRGLSSVAGKLI